MPDEVVIALSGTTSPPRLSMTTRFRVSIVTDPPERNAAANRNRVLALLKGTVILYQDADDVPHPQRVEIVRHLFACYEIDHLMHGFVHAHAEGGAHDAWRAGRYALQYVEQTLQSHRQYRHDYGFTNGNPAVSRDLLGRIRWPEERRVGEDVAFNMRAYESAGAAGRCAVLPLPLLLYRQHLSATAR